MSAQERKKKLELVFELTYSAIGKAFHMSKAEIANTVAEDRNHEITRLYLYLSRLGMARYGLTPFTKNNM